MPHERGHYRNTRRGARIRAQEIAPVNPFPFMSWPEAIVYLELERRQLRFSHRYFKTEWSPTLALMFEGQKPFEPEFTLPDVKVVITVLGEFWGTMPGVLDRMALAKAVLTSEGWRFITLHEVDLKQDVNRVFQKQLPFLEGAPRGPIIPRPGGPPDYLVKLRKALALSRRLIIRTRGTRHASGKRRARRRNSRRRIRRSNRAF